MKHGNRKSSQIKVYIIYLVDTVTLKSAVNKYSYGLWKNRPNSGLQMSQLKKDLSIFRSWSFLGWDG